MPEPLAAYQAKKKRDGLQMPHWVATTCDPFLRKSIRTSNRRAYGRGWGARHLFVSTAG